MTESQAGSLYAEKPLPHNIEAEEAVLGSLLIDEECIDDVLDAGLKPDSFYREKNAVVFAAALRLRERGSAIDQLTLASELNAAGELDAAGGMAYLSHLVSITPTSVNAAYYAELVVKAAYNRQSMESAQQLYALALDNEIEPGGLLEAFDRIVAGAMPEDAPGQRDTSIHAVIDRYLEEEGADRPPPVWTGLADLDTLTGGLKPEELTLLAARPGYGKTALAAQIAAHAAGQGQAVAFFSLEMSAKSILMRLVTGRTGIPYERLFSDTLTDGERNDKYNALGALSFKTFHLVDGVRTVAGIRAKARMLKRREGLALVVVDYVGLMDPDTRRRDGNRNLEVGETSKALKRLAMTEGVSVLAVSQLNREIEHRKNPQPQLSDLRDSGNLEQDADRVMFLYDATANANADDGKLYPDGVATLSVAKQRNGPTGIVRLAFLREHFRFENLAHAAPRENTPANGNGRMPNV